MRPRVKPALRRLDRGGRSLQFGVHPARAVVLADVEPAVREVIDALDGTATVPEVVARARRHGLGEAAVRELLGLLAGCGVLDDAAVRPDALGGLSLAERDRLAPDLDELSVVTGATDGGLGAMRRRRAAHVRVYGAGRVGAQIVALLAAAGVGHLCVVDPGPARRRDLVPGGLGWEHVGRPRDEGAVELARRVAPAVNAGRAGRRRGPATARRGRISPCSRRWARSTRCSWPSSPRPGCRTCPRRRSRGSARRGRSCCPGAPPACGAWNFTGATATRGGRW